MKKRKQVPKCILCNRPMKKINQKSKKGQKMCLTVKEKYVCDPCGLLVSMG